MNLRLMAPPPHQGSAHGIRFHRNTMHEAASEKSARQLLDVRRNIRAMTVVLRRMITTHTCHAEPNQALLIALSCGGARYRGLKPFVRIWKGLWNIAEQNLLCISDVVRTGKVDY